MTLVALLHLEVTAFVYSLVFLVAYGLLVSRINTKGLLLDKSGSGRVRPERVQLLIATLALAGTYMADVSGSGAATFPELDVRWLYLFGGSTGIYVARKIYERYSAS